MSRFSFPATCRNCGDPVEALTEARTDGCVTQLPVRCTNKPCSRSWVLEARMLSMNPAGQDRR